LPFYKFVTVFYFSLLHEYKLMVIFFFNFQTEESYLEELQTELSPFKSPFIVKCSMIFMITQFTTRLYYQCNGVSVLPAWLDSLLPEDILFGRMFQVIVLNSFYIWRLYCADNWQWNDWFSAWRGNLSGSLVEEEICLVLCLKKKFVWFSAWRRNVNNSLGQGNMKCFVVVFYSKKVNGSLLRNNLFLIFLFEKLLLNNFIFLKFN
jgi:hypothetical protein